MKTNLTKPFINLIKKFSYKRDLSIVFTDFLAISAISISNATDLVHYEDREKQYVDIINQYSPEEQKTLVTMYTVLIESMQQCAEENMPVDILGQIFHELEFHNKFKGQFFTPQHISDFMAEITCFDFEDKIKNNGYLSICEPCCGSGVMIISMAKVMASRGYNYCSQLVVDATDIDLKCVHMAYIQLSLYGIPAVIRHGDSLLMKTWSLWYTPLFILNNCQFKEPFLQKQT